MNENEIEHLSIEYILRNTRYSCDFPHPFSGDYIGSTEDEQLTAFWMHVIQYKADDSGFMDLVESILSHGWHPASAVGIYFNDEDGSVQITEGHHRLVAAILLGMDSVPVSKWGQSVAIDGEYISAHMNPHKPDHSLMFELF